MDSRTGLNILEKRKISCPLPGSEPRIFQPTENHYLLNCPDCRGFMMVYIKCRHVLLAFTGTSRFLSFCIPHGSFLSLILQD